MEHIELLNTKCFQGEPFRVWVVPTNHKYWTGLKDKQVCYLKHTCSLVEPLKTFSSKVSIAAFFKDRKDSPGLSTEQLKQWFNSWFLDVKERDFIIIFTNKNYFVIGEVLGPCQPLVKTDPLYMRYYRPVIWCDRSFDAKTILNAKKQPCFNSQQRRFIAQLQEPFFTAVLVSVLEQYANWQTPLISSLACRFKPEILNAINGDRYLQWRKFNQLHPLSLKVLKAFRETGNLPSLSKQVSQAQKQTSSAKPSKTEPKATSQTATLKSNELAPKANEQTNDLKPREITTSSTEQVDNVKPQVSCPEVSFSDTTFQELLSQASASLSHDVNNVTDYSLALKNLRSLPVPALPKSLQVPLNLLSALDIVANPERGSLHSSSFSENSSCVKKFSPKWIATHSKRMQYQVLKIMEYNAQNDYMPSTIKRASATTVDVAQPIDSLKQPDSPVATANANNDATNSSITTARVSSVATRATPVTPATLDTPPSANLEQVKILLWPQTPKEYEDSLAIAQSSDQPSDIAHSLSYELTPAPLLASDCCYQPIEGVFNDLNSETNLVANALVDPVYKKAFIPQNRTSRRFAGLGLKFKTLMLSKIQERLYHSFVEHNFVTLIGELIKAQGFNIQYESATTIGPILIASEGRLGAMSKSFCVQLYPSFESCTVSSLNILRGIMVQQSLDNALLVSWEGFSQDFKSAQAVDFLNFRLWDAQDIVEQFISFYPKLSEQMRSKVPLKRVWCLNL